MGRGEDKENLVGLVELLKRIQKETPLSMKVPNFGHNYEEALSIMLDHPDIFGDTELINLFWGGAPTEIVKDVLNIKRTPPCEPDELDRCLSDCPARMICIHKEDKEVVDRRWISEQFIRKDAKSL